MSSTGSSNFKALRAESGYRFRLHKTVGTTDSRGATEAAWFDGILRSLFFRVLCGFRG